jgi:hypothetical protein
MTPLRPVWLLDVDGVLNAPRPGWRSRPRSGRARSGGFEFTMRFAPPLVQRIVALHRTGRVEVRWATTWVDDIEQIRLLMGLPTWPCAFSLNGSDAVDEAKHRAALDVVRGERRPLIWTDDDVVPREGSHAARTLHEQGPAVLLLRPDPARGLQPHHVEQIETFVAEWADPNDAG